MNNIDPTTEISTLSEEYSKVIQNINNALDECYEVFPDIRKTTGEERKENLDIWLKHINDLKDSCQQLIDEIEEKMREINF
jgi:acyl-CoA reductase-like NAD-dependent aldehyde dehydrogenase